MNMNWLLVFIPIGLTLDSLGYSPMLVFLASALAIVPLAKFMGDATEVLARALGATLGGLMNATLGNAQRAGGHRQGIDHRFHHR